MIGSTIRLQLQREYATVAEDVNPAYWARDVVLLSRYNVRGGKMARGAMTQAFVWGVQNNGDGDGSGVFDDGKGKSQGRSGSVRGHS